MFFKALVSSILFIWFGGSPANPAELTLHNEAMDLLKCHSSSKRRLTWEVEFGHVVNVSNQGVLF